MKRMISLFAGPGGMCLGAAAVGIESIGIELDHNACETRRAAGLPTVEGDVRKYSPSDFPGREIFTAGPPCQTFTVAGKGAGRKSLDDVLFLARMMEAGDDVSEFLEMLSDERTGLVLEPLRWVLEATRSGNPYRTIVLEQVTTVLPVWEEYARIFRTLGYSTHTGLLNAEEYGVPQTRKRAFLVASLNHEANLPTPTHRKYLKGQDQNEGDPSLAPWVSLGEVVQRDTPFWVRSNYNHAGTGERARRGSNEPAFTVTGCVMRNRFFDYNGTELKRFSYAEAGVVQTFPSDYPWSGKAIHQQIGNAAPPMLVAAVLRSVLDSGLAVLNDEGDLVLR